MSVILGSFINYYNYLFTQFEDPLTKTYPLLNYPILIIAILALYFYFVLSWGPKFMANRKPFNLRFILLVFNVIQVLSNLYILISMSSTIINDENHSFMCQPITYDDTPARRNLVRLGYLYVLLKISDMLDTVFFVLRKKSNQISFLHVYHHSMMVLGSFIFTKFLSGSHGVLIGLLNTTVHCFMYSYYFLTIYNPKFKNFIRLKKAITKLQLIQFLILVIYFTIPLCMKSCSLPVELVIVYLIQNLFMLVLFTDFYIRAYWTTKPKLDK